MLFHRRSAAVRSNPVRTVLHNDWTVETLILLFIFVFQHKRDDSLVHKRRDFSADYVHATEQVVKYDGI